jgi:hypothetical protein
MRRITLFAAALLAVAGLLGATAATASAGVMRPAPIVIVDR